VGDYRVEAAGATRKVSNDSDDIVDDAHMLFIVRWIYIYIIYGG